MMTGQTKKGFDFVIDETELNDMEFLELMADVDDNPLLFPKLVEQMLGKEQKTAFYDFYRNEKGKVPIDEVKDAIGEILAYNDETKN